MKTQDKKLRLTTPDVHFTFIEICGFAAIATTLFLFIIGYRFGDGNQISQFPIIYRMLDPSFCVNDFYVNSSMDLGPRTYYAQTMALFSSVIPLAAACFVLTWISAFAAVLVSFYAARDIMKESEMIPLMACVLLVGTIGINNDLLLSNYIVPGVLVHSLALIAIWAGLKNRPVIAALFGALATPIHPLMGLEAGAIGVGLAASSFIFDNKWKHERKNDQIVQYCIAIAIGMMILGATAYFFWLGNYETSLSTEKFIDIMARFRRPHHIFMSKVSGADWVRSVFFLIAFYISWKAWKETRKSDSEIPNKILALVFFIVSLWIASFIFVEVIPTRLWATAQTLRLKFIVNWVVFFVLARSIVKILKREPGLDQTPALIMLMGSGNVILLYSFLGHMVDGAKNRLEKIASRETVNSILAVIIVGGALGVFAYYRDEIKYPILMFSLLLVFVWFIVTRRRWYRSAVPIAISFIVMIGVGVGWYHRVPFVMNTLKVMDIHFTFDDAESSSNGIFKYALESTPKDAVFLTPPDFGQFRLLARRSIVVDFKSFPFQDWAMVEWKQRLDDCYGVTEKGGWKARNEMDDNYHFITDDKIRSLSGKYDIAYAVLYLDTASNLPVVYEDEHYKIVEITK